MGAPHPILFVCLQAYTTQHVYLAVCNFLFYSLETDHLMSCYLLFLTIAECYLLSLTIGECVGNKCSQREGQATSIFICPMCVCIYIYISHLHLVPPLFVSLSPIFHNSSPVHQRAPLHPLLHDQLLKRDCDWPVYQNYYVDKFLKKPMFNLGGLPVKTISLNAALGKT